MTFRMTTTIQLGLFTLGRYEYWIDGYYWTDQKNISSILPGEAITSTSKNPKYFPPLNLDEPSLKKHEDNPTKKKGWYDVGVGVNKKNSRNNKGVLIKDLRK